MSTECSTPPSSTQATAPLPTSCPGDSAPLTAPVTAPLPPCDSAILPDEIPVLQAMIRELLQALKKANHERDGLRERLDLLLRKLYGQKAERFDPNQPWLIPEMDPNVESTTTDAPVPPVGPSANDATKSEKLKPKGHGRKKLPDDLVRIRIEHALSEPERMCPCCGIVCQKFGEDITEQLDYKPASLFVNQHVRFKYACQKCHDHVTVGHVPISIIEKGLPGPGLLAQIVASKYADHLPLYRLERIFARHGVDLARSTMCDWMAHVARMFAPVVDLMGNIVLQSHAIHTDATKMPYLDPDVKGKTASGQLWTFIGDRDHPFNLFRFNRDHSAKCIDGYMKGKYKGYVSADAHNIYDHLFLDGTMLELGCWAHARRNFYDAKDSDPDRAHLVLARIRRLYDIEREAKEEIEQGELSATQADAVRLQHRQTRSLLEVRQLRQWLEAEKDKVLPKSLIGLAIAYALRHWNALTRYLDDGRLAIDNNVAERALRHIAIGRKNWMFAGSATGAETAAILFSVSSSCHRHGVDVFAYVRDLLERLAHDPAPSPEVLRDWLPDRWKPPSTPPPGSVLTSIGPAAGEPTDKLPTVDPSVGNPV